MKGILGRKIGMTQLYSQTGESIAITVIEVQPNVVSKVLSVSKNGYEAVQLAVFDKKPSRINKPLAGHFKKANTTPKRYVKEIRDMKGFELGQLIGADVFTPGELVDVTGISKGKGFAGAIKRHNQKIGPRSHGGGGGSQPVRLTGSLGDISGNKVVKGMTMPGHMGNVKSTIQNLEVVKVDPENNLILIKGSTPGAKKSFVVIKQAVKGLSNNTAFDLVDVKEVVLMNELVEKAKKLNVEVTVGMKSKDLLPLIEAAEAERAKHAEAEKGDK